MTVRVMLVSPALGEAQRQVRFDGGESVDAGALRQTRAVAAAVRAEVVRADIVRTDTVRADAAPAATRCYYGASARCRETAVALGLEAARAPELGDLDVGSWRGRTLDEVTEAEPRAVADWLADPASAPHGGESLHALIARVGAWLDGRSAETGRITAVVEPAVIRAALVHALGLPAAVFWRLDVAPLSVTELSGRAGRWNLRCGRPLGSGLSEGARRQ
ncbi:histidine phosphatase family protein [Streptomyces sp. NPDC053542]|uniref:histidine phosphatase family protein n=1 Tax=Streptomyces sp. NPDC053542 TaxID=3365710 RepID=UPI0037CF17EF